MPDFKPNNQKIKSFLKRLEYTTDVQFSKTNSLLPNTANIGLGIGYKLNDKSIIGIGMNSFIFSDCCNLFCKPLRLASGSFTLSLIPLNCFKKEREVCKLSRFAIYSPLMILFTPAGLIFIFCESSLYFSLALAITFSAFNFCNFCCSFLSCLWSAYCGHSL